MPTEFDDREFPIVRMRPVEASEDHDIHERIAFLDAQLARRERWALVFDTRRSAMLTAAQRRIWGDWVARRDAELHDYVAGAAILVGSATGRAVFTAIFWLWKPPVDCVFVANDDEAERVVREMLAGRRPTRGTLS